jgi:hypothetical protein
MPNGSGLFRLIGVCSLLVGVIALHLYNLQEEGSAMLAENELEDAERKSQRRRS